MEFEFFAEGLEAICSHSLVAPDRSLCWTVIANPVAGGFTIHSCWKRHRKALNACVARAAQNPLREGAGPSRIAREWGGGDSLGNRGLLLTRGPGDAAAIVKALIDKAGEDARNRAPGISLIISAGGDGTSLEVMTALYAAPPAIRSAFAVLRLPMGTGNDGADAWELGDALELLINPVTLARQRGLVLRTATEGKGPFLAFNILSVGLDAFVTYMTNRMKGRFSGDFYKLWVDIAALFYDRLYKVGPLEIHVYDEAERIVNTLEEKVLLLAVGVTGHRTYGSHKRILPDDRNVCIVRQMSLFRKLALKGLFSTGGHVGIPEAILFSAFKVRFRGREPILAQMDGEAVLLDPADFPASIELTEPAIPVLKRI
ncbi:MAG: diacylglycerol kinase [Spirochaetaceae bacterium]|jgi:diacylglycerol kinase family enzyme|nr:diacylglycerol kinase [Spirochaetaceae bacterium]